MALVGGRGAEGEVCILRSPGIATSPISLLSMGEVCGRSLTAQRGKFSSLLCAFAILGNSLCFWPTLKKGQNLFSYLVSSLHLTELNKFIIVFY